MMILFSFLNIMFDTIDYNVVIMNDRARRRIVGGVSFSTHKGDFDFSLRHTKEKSTGVTLLHSPLLCVLDP